jgi:hypothetical protein
VGLTRIAGSLIFGLALAGCASQSGDQRTLQTEAAPVSSASMGRETNASTHPLKHPEFKMVTAPQGTWNSHWMYPNAVMSYLLGRPREAALARRVLAECGLGQGDKSYLFVARAGTPLAVNGNVFKTRQQAVAFIRKEKIPKLLYVPENNAFPTQIPVWLDEEGIQVWVLKWQR